MYTLSEQKRISEYILNILTSNPPVFYSWGAREFVFGVKEEMIFLRLRVSGFVFKGHVYVLYNEGKDLLEVRLVKGEKEVSRTEDVYIDQLVEIVDRLVETGNMTKEEYQQKVDSHKYNL